jgi:hypothetical protein
VLKNIRRICFEKISRVIKEAEEKERKARRKKLRRRWKKVLYKLKLERMEAAKDMVQRWNLWQNFMKKKNVIGELMKENIEMYSLNASRRNEMLDALFRTAATNIRIDITSREENIRKRRIYQESTVKMTSSLEENSLAEILYTNQEETFIEWWHNKFISIRKYGTKSKKKEYV